MKPTRTLSLSTEPLVELSPDVLAGVAGGGDTLATRIDPCLSLLRCSPTRNELRCLDLTETCADRNRA